MNEPTTIQQTSKGWKAAQLIGVVLMCVAVVGFVSRAGWAAPLGLLGVVLYAGGRVGAWWHHG